MIMILPMVVLVLAFILWWASRITYGKYIKADTLDIFFGKYINEYKRLNSLDQDIFSTDNNLPYIARLPELCFSRWYINGFGVIPRLSKWSTVLDEKQKELMGEHKLNNLNQIQP